jgi:hypothetical protein
MAHQPAAQPRTSEPVCSFPPHQPSAPFRLTSPVVWPEGEPEPGGRRCRPRAVLAPLLSGRGSAGAFRRHAGRSSLVTLRFRPPPTSTPIGTLSSLRRRCVTSWHSTSCGIVPTLIDEMPAKRAFHGGGGNRTRVRSRTGLSLYRCSSPFDLAPPAGGERPTAGASHPVVSPLRRLALLRGQPVYDAATRTTGRVRSDASPNYLGGECEIVIRTYVGSRLFYEADRGPRPAAQPENRPRRDLVAPVCS